MISYASNINQDNTIIKTDDWLNFFTGDFYALEPQPEWTVDEVEQIRTVLKDNGVTHLTIDWWNR
jgi:predicted HicB family RNase H-like nuclease